MNIEARCDTCDRTFLLSQIGPESDHPGRCPFCGARFGRHYTTVLPGAVRHAEQAASEFVAALGRVQSMDTGFDLDVEGLMGDLVATVREHQPEPSAR